MGMAQKKPNEVSIFRLGEGSAIEEEMLERGLLEREGDVFYLRSAETAAAEKGEQARAGGYFRVDGLGYPYPIGDEQMKKAYEHVEGDIYHTTPVPMQTWEVSEGKSEEIDWLIDNGKLQIDPDNTDGYFNAELWGTTETAAKDAHIIFYGVDRDENGAIKDIDFNFVEKSEFDRTYDILPDAREEIKDIPFMDEYDDPSIEI